MKNSYLALPLALLMAGCAENLPELQIFNSFQPETDCTVDTDKFAVFSGSLDLASGTRYVLGFELRSTVTNTPINVGADDIPVTGTGDDNAIYLTEVELKYYDAENDSELGDFSDTYPAYFVVPTAADDDGNILIFDLIGPEGLAGLNALVTGPDPRLIHVRLKVKGKTTSGGGVDSNEIAYPITLFNSGATCTAPQVFSRNGPCGNVGGQNGRASCVAP